MRVLAPNLNAVEADRRRQVQHFGQRNFAEGDRAQANVIHVLCLPPCPDVGQVLRNRLQGRRPNAVLVGGQVVQQVHEFVFRDAEAPGVNTMNGKDDPTSLPRRALDQPDQLGARHTCAIRTHEEVQVGMEGVVWDAKLPARAAGHEMPGDDGDVALSRQSLSHIRLVTRVAKRSRPRAGDKLLDALLGLEHVRLNVAQRQFLKSQVVGIVG